MDFGGTNPLTLSVSLKPPHHHHYHDNDLEEDEGDGDFYESVSLLVLARSLVVSV